MEFETDAERDPGARVEDVAQEAIDATATTYSNDPSIDVEEILRLELSSRGVRPTSEENLRELGAAIRSGHPVRVGEHDGSTRPGSSAGG